MNIIKCCKCNKKKLENEFSIFNGRLNKTCKQCREYHNSFYKENKEGYRDKRKEYYKTHYTEFHKRAYKNHLRRKYNLSLEEYNSLLIQQNGKCAICERDFKTLTKWNTACVDHDHKTGKVRGILCRKCNLSLVYIEDSHLWQKAQNYLNQ